jgi:hypothetical protein
LSETVRGHLVGAGIEFDDRGEHELKRVSRDLGGCSPSKGDAWRERANPSNWGDSFDQFTPCAPGLVQWSPETGDRASAGH